MLKGKQLTNIRASVSSDKAIILTPALKMTLEQMIAYIKDDELLEVTLKNLRLKKKTLRPKFKKKTTERLKRKLIDI